MLVRVKLEEEIVESRKTLRVSSPNTGQVEQGSGVDRDASPLKKPLGSIGSRYASDQFSNFFNAYAKTINTTYGRTGSLFQHPFGRVPITSSHQFWNVVADIHQNPQKHGFVKDFRDWKYSSYGIILTNQRSVVNRLLVMKWFGTRDVYLALNQEWVTNAQSQWFAVDDFD
jgi:hypothetical protein